jgi:Tfp pilus assembly protein PilZ
LDTEKDPREYPRRLYRKSLILSYKNQSYKGQFANISRGGVFIKADTKFFVGKQIQIVIPGSEFRKNIKLKGWIVRRNADGFGVKFERRAGREVRKDLDRRTGVDRRSVFDRRDR